MVCERFSAPGSAIIFDSEALSALKKVISETLLSRVLLIHHVPKECSRRFPRNFRRHLHMIYLIQRDLVNDNLAEESDQSYPDFFDFD